jgi:hypothetical protein
VGVAEQRDLTGGGRVEGGGDQDRVETGALLGVERCVGGADRDALVLIDQVLQ